MDTVSQNKSVIDTFTKSTFVLIVLSAVSIGCLISYFSYSAFVTNSERLEEEYLATQKSMLQREVTNAEELIKYSRSKLDKTIRGNIKSRVYDAHAIATNIYEKYKDTKPKQEVVSLIKEALRPLRFFDGRGYIFITALNGKGILHPTATQFEGVSVLHLKNKQGVPFAKDILDITKEKGEGYYRYDWTKPGEQGQFSKVSFFKHFKPYDWTIGTGDYVIEVERNIQKEILERLGEHQFGKEGYVFVVNYDGIVMMNRGDRSLIGNSIINVTDSNGVRVAEEIIKLAHDPTWDGYFHYTWKKLSSAKVSPKIAYHKTVPEWRWYYGAGVYLDDVQVVIENQRDELKKHLLLQLFLIAVTVIAALIILIYLTQKRTKELNYDLRQLLDYFHSLSIKSNPLNTERLMYSEFKQLAKSANAMLDKQKKSEEQRLKFEQQIQQAQKMDAVTQMVGGIAHDFNNLLGIMLGFGELLELKLSDHPELEDYCHEINMAGMRGAKLTRKLLSLTRKKSTEEKRCDINDVLEESKEFLKKSLTSKIELEFDLKEDLWPVCIDQSDFEDVILNLCVNAMHAMKEAQQDFHVTIATDNIQIKDGEFHLNELKPGDYVQLTVSDNGVGMDDEVRARLFEPFYTTRETGTGLGLSQVYGFVQRSAGSILVNSTPGLGTEFQMLFPRMESNPDKLQNTPADNDLTVEGHETILVVDDEKPLRQLCAEILNKHGYHILQAENGVEALVILKNEKVDLLLSDVIMPNMDGNYLAERVKQLYPHIKIQLVSGYMKEDQLSESNHDLYGNLLHKPVDALSLSKHVRQLLDQ